MLGLAARQGGPGCGPAQGGVKATLVRGAEVLCLHVPSFFSQNCMAGYFPSKQGESSSR